VHMLLAGAMWQIISSKVATIEPPNSRALYRMTLTVHPYPSRGILPFLALDLSRLVTTSERMDAL
jgi:hypothetical protein